MRRGSKPKATDAIPTISRLWAIQNYTKYKTQDLVNLFNLVEAQILQNRLRVNTAFKLERPPGYRDDGKMEVPFYIDTYSPSRDEKSRRATSVKIEYLKHRSERDCIRIVDPTVGMSPTEQLSHAGMPEGIPVPQALLVELTSRIVYSYGGAAERIYDNTNQWLAQPIAQAVVLQLKPQLRFLQRPENRKPTIEGGDTRYCRLSAEKASSLKYAVRDFGFKLKQIEELAEGLNAYAKKRKVDPYVDVKKINELFQGLSKLDLDVSIMSKKLFEEHENNQKQKNKE